jgi:hypothetical protein
LLIREGKLETFVENPDQGFTRNAPMFKEIAGGAHIEGKLDLSGGNWRGSHRRGVSFESGDVIIVVYDVPKAYGWAGAPVTTEASKMGVWYGVATALTTIK